MKLVLYVCFARYIINPKRVFGLMLFFVCDLVNQYQDILRDIK